MPFPAATGYVPQNIQDTFGPRSAPGTPPQYVLDAIGPSFTWDPNKYQWDGRYITDTSGGRWDYGDVPDPSLGSYVVLPGGASRTAESSGTEVPNNILPGGGPAYYFEPGQGPTFFGNPAGEGQFFFSNDPAAIDAYQHDARTRQLQGAAQIAGLIGGASALGGALGGGGAASGGAAAADGLSPITVGASSLPGGVPSVGAASAAAMGGATIPGMASLPAGIATPGAVNALTSGLQVGPNGLPTGPMSAAGGGVGAMSGGAPNVGANPGVAGAVGNALTGGGAGNAIGNALGGAAGTAPAWLDYLMGGLNTALGVNAANQASDAQAQAAQAGIDEQRRQFDLMRSDTAPYRQTGTDALGRLNALMGGDMSGFQSSPDYNFRRDEGMRGIENSFAARGGAASGNALRALTDFNSNLASAEYGNYFNRNAGLAGVGQTATNTSAQVGQNTANQIGYQMGNQGDARASGYLGRTNAIQNGLYDGYDNFLFGRRRS